jgi:hypothetical protein
LCCLACALCVLSRDFILGCRARRSMSTPVVDVSPASNPGLTDKPEEVTKSYIMQQAVGFSLSLSLSLSIAPCCIYVASSRSLSLSLSLSIAPCCIYVASSRSLSLSLSQWPLVVSMSLHLALSLSLSLWSFGSVL